MEFTDQTGRTIKLEKTPERIISVVPSQSELLWDLGLRDELIGITKFCIHPEEMFRSVTRIGGTKKLDIEKIKLLNPDLIIANKEENEQSQIEELCRLFQVWISDIKSLADSITMMTALGKILDKEKKAAELTSAIQKQFSGFGIPTIKKKTAYFIWKDPWMLAGRDTFINDMLVRCGLINCIEDEKSRYPEITIAELKKLNPELILLSSEPFPFNQNHINELKDELPDAEILLADGELFSWYGSRLLHSPAYFSELLK